MFTIWRRHTANCPHRAKGRVYLKCECWLWADGYTNGKRTLRVSLKTRNLARARHKAAELAESDKPCKPVSEAVHEFLQKRKIDGRADSTISKYKNTLHKLTDFCKAHEIDWLHEITTENLDEFRAGRRIEPLTSAKELASLRAFFRYSVNRKWTTENPAGQIDMPANVKANEVVPFTPAEVGAILAACDRIGKKAYERLRARAMILLLRYTGLRIGDASMLARDRISPDGERVRIFLRTEKSGQPVFLPVPPELKAALDAVPPPATNPASRHYFWNGTGKPKTHKAHIDRCLRAVFKESGVVGAHAHRFRHTLATELLGRGATYEEVADILGNSPAIVRKHYGKWSAARQSRIDDLMQRAYFRTDNASTNRELVQ